MESDEAGKLIILRKKQIIYLASEVVGKATSFHWNSDVALIIEYHSTVLNTEKKLKVYKTKLGEMKVREFNVLECVFGFGGSN